MSKLHYLRAVVSLILLIGSSIASKCPQTVGHLLHRLNSTPYYIAHDSSREHFVSFEDAHETCEHHGMRLAKVKDMVTMSVVSRAIENYVRTEKLRDTWYWLDATFNANSEKYKWGRKGSEGDVEYSNFLYRKYRPTGLGSHVNFKGYYEVHNKAKQCLTLALPWPNYEKGNQSGVEYGFQASFDERPCISTKGRHALCQSKEKDCSYKPPNAFTLIPSPGIYDYFLSGNWIFGDRKYIVNWRHRTLEQTEKYCKSLGLELLDPTTSIDSLIPFLKMWSRNVTVSQFWTSLTFDPKSKEIRRRNGEKIDNSFKQFEDKSPTGFRRLIRSNKMSQLFCVSLMMAYELKNQMPCSKPGTSVCKWSFLEYIPANCNNYLGAICQHKNAKDRAEPNWKFSYFADSRGIDKALTDTATTPFGYAGNAGVLRSTYKQTFGSLVCPKGYQMMTTKSRQWASKPPVEMDDIYFYDFTETYWLVDEQGFKINIDSKCTVSAPNSKIGFKRKTKQVKCTEWHFYLCERQVRPTKEISEGQNQTSLPSMQWNDQPQPRIYPIVV